MRFNGGIVMAQFTISLTSGQLQYLAGLVREDLEVFSGDDAVFDMGMSCLQSFIGVSPDLPSLFRSSGYFPR